MTEMWSIREADSYFDPTHEYAQNPCGFTLKVNHGGDFRTSPQIRYERGNVDYVDKVNSDHFSLIIMDDMVDGFGYSKDDVVAYHFRVPGEDLELGLRPLKNDSDVINMIQYVETNKVIEVYVEHARRFKNDYDRQVQGNNKGKNIIVEVNDSAEGSDEGSEEDSDEEGNEGSDEGGDEGSDERNEDDADFIVDEENLIEDYSLDMDLFRAAVDFDISDQADENDEPEDGDELDLEEFDSLTDSDNDTPLQRAVRSLRKKRKKIKKIRIALSMLGKLSPIEKP